jgi:hypothetical protein
MRRSNSEIADPNELKEIVQKADVCRIAFSADVVPYIVTLNFGFKWEEHLVLYFHGAKEGKKIDMLKKNNLVCFEMDIEHEIIKEGKACDWGMKYRSIIGMGRLKIVEDIEEKRKGLDLIMDHYGYKGKKEYNEKIFNVTEILKLDVMEMAGKKKK